MGLDLACVLPCLEVCASQVVVTDVIGAPLQQRRGHRNAERRPHGRQVAAIELVLKGLGPGRDDDLAGRQDCGDEIGEVLPVPVPASHTRTALSRIASATRAAISTCCALVRYSGTFAASGPSFRKTDSSSALALLRIFSRTCPSKSYKVAAYFTATTR